MKPQVGAWVRVEFFKYPEGALHYFWEAKVVEVRPEGVLTLLPQGGLFHHVSKGRSVVLDHEAYVAFFPGAWYSGGPDVREGRVLEYYWNIQTPFEWTGEAFRQYDLELDVKCRADHACEVFDREEFLRKRPLYPEEWVLKAEEAVGEVFRHMAERRWPVLPPGEALPWMERI
ncbi:MAG: DUF402 domain-containing protein [Thermus sp.]|mgnify:CR=1 FL=1|uniref:DUF402 domain-containing protein n=1 Tax=Thermus sp. TaxID=275 RepID=UPI00332221FF